jgi:hypothetical protein
MKLFILPFIVIISGIVSGQEIAGKWYSKDSTRIYLIYNKDGQFEAILEKSDRKGDREGTFILRHVTYLDNRKRFEGMIYAANSGMPTLAKINFEDKSGKVLRLRLRRMFFMNVTIKWYRVEESETTRL